MEQFICPRCGGVIDYNPSEKGAYEVILDHAPACPGRVTKLEVKRIEEVVPKEVLEGNFISIEEVLGKYIMVISIDWKDSTFKEDTQYLSLEIEVDGEPKILNTGAERVLQVFRTVKAELLPLYVCFEKLQLPGGRRVYRIKSG